MRCMQVSLGQLVNMLYETYANRFHDSELAAVATETTLNDMLAISPRPKSPRRG